MSGRRADVPSAPERVGQRILSAVQVQPDGCWFTHHALTGAGYAKVGWSLDGRRQTSFGHIIVFEFVNGRVPTGFELDHLCRVPRCVNPDHLEVVTAQTNQLRGFGLAGKNARKTHCPQGHPYSDENTYRSKSGRQCKTCMAESLRRRRAAMPRKPRPKKTACLHGHPYDAENTYTDKRGRRMCRECGRTAAREYQARRRAAA